KAENLFITKYFKLVGLISVTRRTFRSSRASATKRKEVLKNISFFCFLYFQEGGSVQPEIPGRFFSTAESLIISADHFLLNR
ncbi:MAG TPA: hypothetical protein PKH58_05695, partial [Paludibacteraceae bacterium]|nr:hypothetical protein [Paludibacteraceae bacterium]